mgnify:FL=1
MLIISRKPGESFLIGDDIEVIILGMDGKVRIGIDAPENVPILRKEIAETRKENLQASRAVPDGQLKDIKKLIDKNSKQM